MGIRANPDGTFTRFGGSGSGPYNPKAPGLNAGTGYGGVAPPRVRGMPGFVGGTVTQAAPVAPAAPAPAPATGGGGYTYGGVSPQAQQFLQANDRDHIMNGAYTPQEKASKTGETIITPGGVTYQPGKTTYISTAANGRGGYGGYGGGGYSPGGGYGGGGAGYGRGGAGGFVGQQLQNDVDEANRKNEERYQQELDINAQSKTDQLGALSGGYGDVYSTLAGNKAGQMDFLSGVLGQEQDLTSNFGTTQHALNARRAADQKSKEEQRLVSSGLNNSTVVGSSLARYDLDQALMDNAVDEGVNRDRLGILQNYGSQGEDVLGRNDAAMAAAKLGYANALPETIRGADSQRISIIDNRTDQGPDVNAYVHQLNQPGSLGGGYGGGGAANGRPVGFNFGRGGGGGGYDNDNGIGDLAAYLGAMGYGPGAGGGGGYGGASPYVDPSTIDANRRVRAQGNSRLYNSSYGYGAY